MYYSNVHLNGGNIGNDDLVVNEDVEEDDDGEEYV